MKQEAANTFSEGLNYDLNATTTPNNVLTDCINGTFLTFNGDELALQNDAGNTKIFLNVQPNITGAVLYIPPIHYYGPGSIVYTTISGVLKYYRFISLSTSTAPLTDATVWEEIDLRQYVSLTEGFYPIGIKEYGGVLYIVSAKQPDVIAGIYDENTSYTTGDIVYATIVNQVYYYESLIDNNSYYLPLETNLEWKLIGSEKDYINEYGYVEFGSYPSPEIFHPELFDTSIDYSVVNTLTPTITPPLEFKLNLYSPKSINDSIFQAGTYVSFQKLGSLVVTNVSYQKFLINSTTHKVFKNPIQEPSIYKIRLLHQLSNGFIDLTDDVWLKYAQYVYDTTGVELNKTVVQPAKYWFTDPNFKYYCPHNFKGKLVISTELENLDTFELPYTTITTNGTYYTVTFNISYTNTTDWNQSVTPSFTVYYTTDGTEPTLTGTSIVGGTPLSLLLPMALYPDNVLKYKLLPNFYFGIYQVIKDYLPQQFLDYHTISGSQSLEVTGDDIILARDLTNSYCELTGGLRTFPALTLQNSKGENLTNELDVTTVIDKYQYYLDGYSGSAKSLGTFKLEPNGKASWLTSNPLYPITPSADAYIKSLLAETYIQVEDVTCNTVELVVTINKDFGSSWPIAVYQHSIMVDNMTKVGLLSYSFRIEPGVDFNIRPNVSGVMSGYDSYNLGITNITEINFGMITNPGYTMSNIADSNVYKYVVDMTPIAFGPNIYQGTGYTLTQTVSGLPNVPTGGYLSGTIGTSGIIFYQYKTINYPADLTPSFNISFLGPIDSSWPNLSSETVVSLGAGHLFKASYIFPQDPTGSSGGGII